MKNPQQKLINRVRSLVSIGKIKTLREARESLSLSPRETDSDSLVTKENLKALFEEFLSIKDNGKIKEYSLETQPDELGTLIKPPPYNPKQTARLFPTQHKVARQIYHDIVVHKTSAGLLRVDTGLGKTYVYLQVLRWLLDSGWICKNCISAYPMAIITKASIVEQTRRVAADEFGLCDITEVMVINIDAMRSGKGELFIDKSTTIIDGEPIEEWTWKPFLHPVIVIWDECQTLKNIGSKQSKLSLTLTDTAHGRCIQLFSSATPFSKIASAQAFAVACRAKLEFYPGQPSLTLTNRNWPMFANRISTDQNPHMYSKAALKRFMKAFDRYIYTYRMKPEFSSIESLIFRDFLTQEDTTTYVNAWEHYLEMKAKIEGEGRQYGGMLILAQLTIFAKIAELLYARILAMESWQAISSGKSVIIACRFKTTIAKCVQVLFEDYGMSRQEISLIWGGEAALASKERISDEDMMEILNRLSSGIVLPGDRRLLNQMERQLQMADAGLVDLDPSLNLGIQTKLARQEEIDRFQSGISKICLFTFQAGGAGLSLHHDKPTLLPRRTFLTPTYNEMELEQGLGRAHRLTSLSNTEQSLMVFKGTVQMEILRKVTYKRKALRVVLDHEMCNERKLQHEAEIILSKTRSKEEQAEEAEFGEDVWSEEES